MKNTKKKLKYDKQKLNLKFRKQEVSKNSTKKILIIYVKGLKIFNLLNKNYISK
jgi:hypothetical protein